MLIRECLKQKDVTLSFEVFPPKPGMPFQPVQEAVTALSQYTPDFMSVTYGAGGGTSQNTIDIASFIQKECGTAALAHLSCVSSSRAEVAQLIGELRAKGIQNVLALRGDIPDGMTFPEAGYYKYAYQLVEEIKSRGDFCVGAACYPEGHVECASSAADLSHLKAKVDCGCDFLITQMFFDNHVLYSFLYRALRVGIDVPVIAGVMPVTSGRQIKLHLRFGGDDAHPEIPLHPRPLWRPIRGGQAGRYRLRDRSNHRPVSKWREGYPSIYNE